MGERVGRGAVADFRECRRAFGSGESLGGKGFAPTCALNLSRVFESVCRV